MVGDLATYVSEEQSPANRKGVSLVEVFDTVVGGDCIEAEPGIGKRG